MVKTDYRIIENYLKNHSIQVIGLIEEFEDEQISNLLESLPLSTASTILSSLVPFKASKVLSLLDEKIAVNLLGNVTEKKAGSLLLKLEEQLKLKLLKRLPKELRERITYRLSYSKGSVGAHADTDVLTLRGDQLLEDCLKLIESNLKIVHSRIYVLSKEEELMGFIELKDLLEKDKQRRVADIVREKPMTFLPSMSIEDLQSQWDYQFLHLPIVDAEGGFLGTISRKVIKEVTGNEDLHQQPAFRAGSALSELYQIGFISLLGTSRDSDFKDSRS